MNIPLKYTMAFCFFLVFIANVVGQMALPTEMALLAFLWSLSRLEK